MFKNYIKTAWRNLIKQKAFSILNISGLAIGLSCFLLIAIYIIDEISYDKFHAKASHIYRINSAIRFGGADMKLAVTADPMGAALKKDYPQVEEYVRIYNSNGGKLIKKDLAYIPESRVAHVDSTFFNVFTFEVLEGDAKTALNEPNTVVLTESAAIKYFNTTKAVGKTIETNERNSTLYKVTAVIKDIPRTSHFDFDFLFSMDNVEYGWGSFLSHNFYTYLLLKEGTDVKQFEKNFAPFIANYVMPEAKQVMNIQSIEEFQKSGNTISYSLIPITDIHLNSDYTPEITAGGNLQYVYIFSAVAVFILILACINFMNLTTARSASRAKEVGIRKVLGTERKQLIGQFLFESTLMALISLLLAICIAFFMLPLFNEVSGKQMELQTLFSPVTLPLLIALPFVVGILAGSYPAFYLSAFQPIQILKNKLHFGSKGSGLRSALVVFQFATSIVLIIGTIVIYRQLNYIQTKQLGFKKDQVLVIDDFFVLGQNAEAFRNEMLKQPSIKNATFSSYLPVANSSRNDNTFSKEAVMDAKSGFNMQVWKVDDQYIPTMGMELARGRNFSKTLATDSNSVILNESAAKILGYDDPIGKKIYTIADYETGALSAFQIIGVIKNFHFQSLKENIGPLSFQLGRSIGSASFKIEAGNTTGILKQAESIWKTMAPNMPFNYRFLDEAFDQMYRAEQRVGKIALIFSMLAIFIGCLGLFGLAAFVAEQRTKEIGVRKVLGASVKGIVHLLSKDFIRLVFIAFIIAAPIAWWAMNRWLQDFVYRVAISWWIFLAAAFIAISIALITVSFQAIKAAITNPVKNLRAE
jgi:putative ABC transport system permease protein